MILSIIWLFEWGNDGKIVLGMEPGENLRSFKNFVSLSYTGNLSEPGFLGFGD
jgi:hypothetical protein